MEETVEVARQKGALGAVEQTTEERITLW